MKLIKVTAPNGQPVWVNPDMICTISDSVDNIAALCMIRHAGGPQYVKERPETVVVMVEHGDNTA